MKPAGKNPEQFTVQEWVASIRKCDAEDFTTKLTIRILSALDPASRAKILRMSIVPFWEGADELGVFYRQLILLSPRAWERMTTACDQAIPSKEITPSELTHAFVDTFEKSVFAAVYFSKKVIFLVAGQIIFFEDGVKPFKFKPSAMELIAPMAAETLESITKMFKALEKHCRWDDWGIEAPSDESLGNPTEYEIHSVIMVVPGNQFIQFHRNGPISLEYTDSPERRTFRLGDENDAVARPVKTALENFQKLSHALEGVATQ